MEYSWFQSVNSKCLTARTWSMMYIIMSWVGSWLIQTKAGVFFVLSVIILLHFKCVINRIVTFKTNKTAIFFDSLSSIICQINDVTTESKWLTDLDYYRDYNISKFCSRFLPTGSGGSFILTLRVEYWGFLNLKCILLKVVVGYSELKNRASNILIAGFVIWANLYRGSRGNIASFRRSAAPKQSPSMGQRRC